MPENEIPTRLVKNFLINPRIQLKIIAILSFFFIFNIASLYAVIYLFFWRFKEKAISIGIPEGHVFFEFLNGQRLSLDTLFWSVGFVNFLLLAVVTLVLTHRFVGPIERLKKHLSSIDKESEDFKVREHDFFQKLPKFINELRNKLK